MGESLFGRHRICAVIAAPTAKEMARQLRRALRFTRTVELRLDYLRSNLERGYFLGWLDLQRPRATMIATCRVREAGGRFTGGLAAQSVFLAVAAAVGCRWCDIEMETAARFGTSKHWKRFLNRARVVFSCHDFRGTPGNLAAIVRRLERWGGDAIKIATQCNSIADSLSVLALARGKRRVVAVPMGEMGLPARVLALREGSALAYGAAGEATAPGQLTLEEMKNLYGADKVDRRTRGYGVIGNPVGHSLSPLLHNSGFQARQPGANLWRRGRGARRGLCAGPGRSDRLRFSEASREGQSAGARRGRRSGAARAPASRVLRRYRQRYPGGNAPACCGVAARTDRAKLPRSDGPDLSPDESQAARAG